MSVRIDIAMLTCMFIPYAYVHILFISIMFVSLMLISYVRFFISYTSLHQWAAICGILAPVLGTIVFLLMLLDCCCKVCCSNLIQTILLTGAEVRYIGFITLLSRYKEC